MVGDRHPSEALASAEDAHESRTRAHGAVPTTLRLLADLRAMTGECAWMFPSFIDPELPMSDGTLIQLVYRLGYRGRMTPHGARSIFSTWAHEAGYSSYAIERQLAHAPADRVKAAYLRSEFLAERVRLMTAWSSFLVEQERAANVVSIGRVATRHSAGSAGDAELIGGLARTRL